MEKVVTELFLKDTYQGKKVFITGHTGFKGSWLAAWLYTLGATVKGYALAPEYDNGLFGLIENEGMIESVIADIRDTDRVSEEILSFQPDYIFHLAAQPLVRRSYELPTETFDINVTGTASVLEAAAKLQKACTIVVITTDKVYENKEIDVLYKEDDQLGGYDPYSASKACTEIVVNSFRRSFFNANKYSEHKKAIASVRAGNVIGGGDWSVDRIVPDIARALLNNETIGVRNPNAVRPWQHVLEPLGGYLLVGALLNKDPEKYATAYNFGPLPADHLTVKELVEIAIKVWGNGNWEDTSSPTAVHEANLLKLDIAKAKEELGWIPKLNASAAISWTIEWYKKPVAEQLSFSVEQIKTYQSL